MDLLTLTAQPLPSRGIRTLVEGSADLFDITLTLRRLAQCPQTQSRRILDTALPSLDSSGILGINRIGVGRISTIRASVCLAW
jgi:hypothetical protein